MGDWSSFGKILISIGLFIVLLGFILFGLSKLFNIGRLPGDIYYQKGNFTFYFPIVTSILISIILTIILNLFNR
ncbi:MAG: hypothetical protein PWQ67_2351 [Clostridia bacterium]|jgi:hypothetical protein|nr:hypothetical protein [Clostridia bacterium]MDN5323897.1 hypothetical protein [Clostridia bacterium]